MNPADELEFNDLDQARSELREGIETSRQIVRQSRLLIELSETDGASSVGDDLGPVAN